MCYPVQDKYYKVVSPHLSPAFQENIIVHNKATSADDTMLFILWYVPLDQCAYTATSIFSLWQTMSYLSHLQTATTSPCLQQSNHYKGVFISGTLTVLRQIIFTFAVIHADAVKRHQYGILYCAVIVAAWPRRLEVRIGSSCFFFFLCCPQEKNWVTRDVKLLLYNQWLSNSGMWVVFKYLKDHCERSTNSWIRTLGTF